MLRSTPASAIRRRYATLAGALPVLLALGCSGASTAPEAKTTEGIPSPRDTPRDSPPTRKELAEARSIYGNCMEEFAGCEFVLSKKYATPSRLRSALIEHALRVVEGETTGKHEGARAVERSSAADVLREMKASGSGLRLLAAMRRERDLRVRTALWAAAGATADVDALPGVFACAVSKTYCGLGRNGWASVGDALEGYTADVLVPFLRDNWPDKSGHEWVIVRSAGEIVQRDFYQRESAGAKLLDALSPVVTTDTGQQELHSALAKLGYVQSIERLVEGLASHDPNTRSHAANKLVGVVGQLTPAQEKRVVQLAKQALANTDERGWHEAGFAKLLQLLTDEGGREHWEK